MSTENKQLKDKLQEDVSPTVNINSIFYSNGLPFETWLMNRNMWKSVNGSPISLKKDTKIIDIFKAAKNNTFYYISFGMIMRMEQLIAQQKYQI